MKNDNYTVWFGDMWEKVNCGSFREAAIIACARRIEDGLNLNITNITCKEYPEIMCESCKLDLIMLG